MDSPSIRCSLSSPSSWDLRFVWSPETRRSNWRTLLTKEVGSEYFMGGSNGFDDRRTFGF